MSKGLTHNRFLPWLMLLFFGSGCAALMYVLLSVVAHPMFAALGLKLGKRMAYQGSELEMNSSQAQERTVSSEKSTCAVPR